MEKSIGTFIGRIIGRIIGWGINFFILKYAIIFALYSSNIEAEQDLFWITIISVVGSFLANCINFGFGKLAEMDNV